MSHWNYRIIHHEGSKFFTIHEVYYDDENRPWGCTEEGAAPMGETLAELKRDFGYMLKAFRKPVIKWRDVEKWGEDTTKTKT